MEKQTDFLEYEEHIYNVFSHRVEHTMLGTAWRLIMDNRRTVVLVPFQTPKNILTNLGLVPRLVESVLSDLAVLARGVFFAYTPRPGTKEYNDPHTEGWPGRCNKYADKKIAQNDSVAGKTAFELIQTANLQWGGKKLSVAKLKELRDMLFKTVRRERGYEGGACLTHIHLKYIRHLWKKITEQDLTAGIMLAYNNRMPAHICELAKKTAEVEGMTEFQALQMIINRVSHVAELGDAAQNLDQYGVLVLLQSVDCAVHNKEDEEEFRRVAPTEAEREEIQAANKKLQLRKLSSQVAGVSDESEGPITRKQAAAFIHKSQATLTNFMRKKIIRFHKTGNNVWFFKNEISEDLKKYGWDKKTSTKK